MIFIISFLEMVCPDVREVPPNLLEHKQLAKGTMQFIVNEESYHNETRWQDFRMQQMWEKARKLS